VLGAQSSSVIEFSEVDRRWLGRFALEEEESVWLVYAGGELSKNGSDVISIMELKGELFGEPERDRLLG
jgi:hypothetical protein